jgi:hypothetical protein
MSFVNGFVHGLPLTPQLPELKCNHGSAEWAAAGERTFVAAGTHADDADRSRLAEFPLIT